MKPPVVVALDRFADAIAAADERGDVECRGMWKLSAVGYIHRAVAMLNRIYPTRTGYRWVEELAWRMTEVTRWRIGDGEWMAPDAFVRLMEADQ